MSFDLLDSHFQPSPISFFKAVKNFLPSAFHCFCSCCDYSITNVSNKSIFISQDFQTPIISSILPPVFSFPTFIPYPKKIMSIINFK